MPSAALSARKKSFQRQQLRARRHVRVRKRVIGTAERPRLAVFRSSRHIYAQIIDDTAGRTIVSASTQDADLRTEKAAKSEVAKRVGSLLAGRARAAGIEKVVFDRGGFAYHGRVAALATGAREGGLEF